MSNDKKINENCPCTSKYCPRHGHCDECREYHGTNGGLPACKR